MEICQEGENSWTVYSPTFDYMSCGHTQEEALKNFEDGLYATIEERIKANCDPLLP